MRSGTDLPDVNVWVALSSAEHQFHQSAEKYWKAMAQPRLAFCRVTSLGLVRVTSQRHTLGGAQLTTMEAWANYMAWRELSGIDFLHEPSGVEQRMQDWVSAGLVTANNWTDLYLAAFAWAGSLRLVTFDQAFARMPDLELLLL